MLSRSHDPHRERGAAAVELALVMPVLILLLFGIVQFGLAMNAENQLTHAAREGVRPIALGSGDTAVSTAKAAAASLDPARLTVGAPEVCQAGTTTCSAWNKTGNPCRPGYDGRLKLTYTMPIDIPLWPGSGSKALHAEARMRCGG